MTGKRNRNRWILWLMTLLVVLLAVSGVVWYTGHNSPRNEVTPPPVTPSTGGSNVITTSSENPLSTPSDYSTEPGYNPAFDPSPGQVRIFVYFTPSAATVEVDGQVLVPDPDAPGWVDAGFTPGTHVVSVSMDGFAAFTKKLNLEEGDTYPLFAVLKSDSPSTKDYYEQHPDDQLATQVQAAVEESTAPVLNLFPLKGDGFVVELVAGTGNFSQFQVTCRVAVISRLDCKSAARAAVNANPILLNPQSYVFVFNDA